MSFPCFYRETYYVKKDNNFTNNIKHVPMILSGWILLSHFHSMSCIVAFRFLESHHYDRRNIFDYTAVKIHLMRLLVHLTHNWLCMVNTVGRARYASVEVYLMERQFCKNNQISEMSKCQTSEMSKCRISEMSKCRMIPGKWLTQQISVRIMIRFCLMVPAWILQWEAVLII